jgi:hypothetical protein
MSTHDTIVTLHDGGGSRVEAADPIAAFGPFTASEAEQVVNMAHGLLSRHPDPHIRRECWLQTITFTTPPVTTTLPDGSPVPPGHKAVDVGLMLNELAKEH